MHEDLGIAFLGGAAALWNTILAWTCVAEGGALLPRRACCALCPALGLATLAMAQLALGGGVCYGRGGMSVDASDEAVAVALFGALSAQSVAQIVLSGAKPSNGRVAPAAAWPCAGVQLITLAYFNRAELLQTSRGDAAAATWIVRGDGVAATPRPRRG